MKYKFTLEKNIHMYNHLITCTDGHSTYSAVCESAPERERTLIFWPEDFGLPRRETEILEKELRRWAGEKGFACIMYKGKGR